MPAGVLTSSYTTAIAPGRFRRICNEPPPTNKGESCAR